jgi:hypothetical protein
MTNMLDSAQADLHLAGAPAPTIGRMANLFTTRSEWLAAHPPRNLSATLAEVAERSRRGEDFHYAVREFLDQFNLQPDHDSRTRSIAERPASTPDPRLDAYLGALAEHLATVHALPRPEWSVDPDRFLDRFWFVSKVPGFRAIAIAQAPAAFRRRGIFIPERSLHRV